MGLGLYILVPLSVVLVFAIGLIFWWSVRSGQFDDLEGPGFRVIVDDQDPVSERVESGRAIATDDGKPADEIQSEAKRRRFD